MTAAPPSSAKAARRRSSGAGLAAARSVRITLAALAVPVAELFPRVVGGEAPLLLYPAPRGIPPSPQCSRHRLRLRSFSASARSASSRAVAWTVSSTPPGPASLFRTGEVSDL